MPQQGEKVLGSTFLSAALQRGSRRISTRVRTIFDSEYYLKTNPDVLAAGLDPYSHFLERGWAELRDPSPYFDTSFYIDSYDDVEAVGINPLHHYLVLGEQEGRRPNALFDPVWYFRENADVVSGKLGALEHYLLHGRSEKRLVHPLFDEDYYLRELNRHGLAVPEDPFAHFIETGTASKISPHPLFDMGWYTEKYADIAKSGINPLAHYADIGWREERNPHPLFWTSFYIQQRSDLCEQNPLAYYWRHGRHEGDAPNPYFDPAFYLETYPDIAESKSEPFSHFLVQGHKERRRTSNNFHTDWYVEKYPEAETSGTNPLSYYITVGLTEDHGSTAINDAIAFADNKAISAEATDKTEFQKAKNSANNLPKAGLASQPVGSLMSAEKDAKGRLRYPQIRRGDGRRIALYRETQDHRWYDSAIVDEFLSDLTDSAILPGVKRLLVIGHDFSMKTGVMRSLAHYLNALVAAGGVEVLSVELVPGGKAMAIKHEAEVQDFVIFNSLKPFFDHEDGLDLIDHVRDRAAIYLHETDFVFDSLKQKFPERYKAFAQAAESYNFLTVSQQQEEMLARRFNARRVFRVHETSPVHNANTPSTDSHLDANEPLTIVMAGTLQPRKGVSLFSEVADLAKTEGLSWKFKWAGPSVGDLGEIYQSENVEFLGELTSAEMDALVRDADAFFLSSIDDPFPLAGLEALQMYCRLIAYRKTGMSEIIGDLPGCAIYETHDAKAAFEAVRLSIGTPLARDALKTLNSKFSLAGFASKMACAITQILEQVTQHKQSLDETPQITQKAVATKPPKIAAVVHLYYHDLWDEIAACLENLRHLSPDVYVSITSDTPKAENDEIRRRILNRWPEANVLEFENRGMDVGPFIETVKLIKASSEPCDLILKLHSKKSITVSGESHGRDWRRKLFNCLAGSVETVDRIVSIFEQHSDIGMVGPAGFRLQKTSHDQKAGRVLNQNNMELLADHLGIADRAQDFFAGTMFWIRAKTMHTPLDQSRLSINDFELGHQPDNSRAHAMERLFASIVRSTGSELCEFNPKLPKSISLLKDRHKGEDIYVVASGASAGFIPPEFFQNKIVIGVNRVFNRFPCNYVIFKEFGGIDYQQELLASGAIPITAQWDSGNRRQGRMRPNLLVFTRPEYYFYDHAENAREQIDLSVIDKTIANKLVVSYSTITSAMHLAAIMGASNVILVGHDCGLLDGKANFESYYRDMSTSPWESAEEYAEWLSKIEAQTISVRERISEVFGINTVSLNPFVNFGLEGHKYTRTAIGDGDSKQASGKSDTSGQLA